jgi:hypothetical protein
VSLVAVLVGLACGSPALKRLPGTLEVDPTALHFDQVPVGGAVSREIAFRNPSARTVTITSASIASDVGGVFALVDPAPTQLQAATEARVRVELRPSTAGAQSARLVIESDADNAPVLEISLTGTGTAAPSCDGVLCDNPPPAYCADSATLTTAASPGQCVDGGCGYARVDRACPQGCSAGKCLPDPCATIACDQPPVCFGGGTCVNGACRYTPTASAACDDHDPCTTGDQCSALGACRGTAGACGSDGGVDGGIDAGPRDGGLDGGRADGGADAGTSTDGGSDGGAGGCWTDSATGLAWTVPLNTLLMNNWVNAGAFCSGQSHCGRTGWRLPTIDELRGVVRGCPATVPSGSCAIHDGSAYSSWVNGACRCAPDAGPGPAACYWDPILGTSCGQSVFSSSVVPDLTGFVWSIDYRYGLVHAVLQYDSSNVGNFVTCVQ